MQNQKIVVTGGAGFLGSHVVRLLLEQGNTVVVLDNFYSGKMSHLEAVRNHPRLEIVRGDIRNPDEVFPVFRDCSMVIHLAVLDLRQSIKEPNRVNETITTGTINCLEAARANGISLFVNCSSAEVYGSSQYIPMDENHPLLPETPYAAAKVAQDMYTYSYGRSYGLPWMTIRIFNMYGPNSHWQGFRGELIPKMIVRAMNGKPLIIFGDGSQTRDFVYVEDAARALITMADTPGCNKQVLQFCTGVETSVSRIAEMVCQQFGIDPKKGIRQEHGRPGDVRRQRGDNSRFVKIVGYRPTVSLEEGIARTVDWYRSLKQSPAELLAQEVSRNWE